MGLPYIDIHTHRREQKQGVIALYNVLVGKGESAPPEGCCFFSAGLHPWHIDERRVDEQIAEVEMLVTDPRCLAIGESGLDRLTATPFTLQQRVFELHLRMAASSGKPLVVHCVKAHAEIAALVKKANIKVPVIFHGFNNNRRIADQLVNEGFYLSFGKALLNLKSNASQILLNCPDDRFFLETDDAEISIEVVYQKAAELCNPELYDLKAITYRNFKNCFGIWE